MQNIKIYPETVFIFDLHGVIFKLDTLQVIKQAITTPHKFQLLKTLFFPKTIFNTLISLKKGAIAEEVLLKLAQDLPQFENLLSTGFNIINAQKPIWGTINVIKNLKSDGHKVYTFSNIGDHSMNILQKKYQNIFDDFDGILGSTQKDNYIKKPSFQAFEKCVNFFNVDKSKVIFIDDKIKNINAAKEFGFEAILFKDSKNFQNIIINLKNK